MGLSWPTLGLVLSSTWWAQVSVPLFLRVWDPAKLSCCKLLLVLFQKQGFAQAPTQPSTESVKASYDCCTTLFPVHSQQGLQENICKQHQPQWHNLQTLKENTENPS
ncbi:hypothetical protein F5141DRAFT_1065112 [Pisolithus sp. B1]|nr:hypothetical protein F5141DRAFT_1065112 [Pisolithus sp. B1]